MTSSPAGSRAISSNEQEEFGIKARNPLMALFLSICPGLGQQYAGHLLRGIVLYIALVIFSWLAAIAYMYVESPAVGLLLLSVPFVGVALIALDAYLCAKHQPLNYRLKWYNGYWIYAGIFLTLLLTVNPLMDSLVGRHIVRALFITSESMQPAVLKRDLVVINKLAKPKRGDIVLVMFKQEDKKKKSIAQRIKESSITNLITHQVLRRVIGRPGDTVEIHGRQVYLNGEPLQEDYASFGGQGSLNPLIDPDYKMESMFIPAGHYFVLSDARQYGFDSRDFGLVDEKTVSGVATKVFWSWNLDQGHFLWNRTAMSLR